MMVKSFHETRGYECVDPATGGEVWRLDDPALEPEQRRRLEAHLAVCDACRLQRDVERRVGRGLAAGTLTLRRRSGTGRERRRAARRLVWSGGLAVAASLVLLLLVPPRPRDAGRVERAGGEPVIRRPVEGEVVAGGHLRLSWQPVPGATAYRVSVSEVGGDFAWQGRTRGTDLALPADVVLPPGRDFRAVVTPVPPDVGPPGGLTVSFRCGNRTAWLRYRLRAAPPWIPLLGLVGMILLLAGWLRPVRPRYA